MDTNKKVINVSSFPFPVSKKMEDDPQDLGGKGNHEPGDKAIVIKNTQKPGA